MSIHNRFKDAPWFDPTGETYVMVGGAGGIGSWTTLLLSRANFSPYVVDFDLIEEHNLGGQLFGREYIGIHKVSALQDIIHQFTGMAISISSTKIDENSPIENLAISAFDNMKARKDMFTVWKKIYGGDYSAIFIDGRLQAEHMQIFCVRGGDLAAQKLYEDKHLFNDSEVEDAPCTMKQTSHAAAMIASHIVGFLTNHITNVKAQHEIRDIPFFWEYFIPMNYLQSEKL